MNEPVERVTQTYGMNALWHEMDEERRRQAVYGPPVKKRQSPIQNAVLEYSFDSFAQRAAGSVVNIWNALRQLKSSAEDLQSGISPLRRRTVHTSEDRAITASAADGAKLHTYTVRIETVAREQINRSLWLHRREEFAWAGEKQELTLSTAQASKTLELLFMPGDTNETALGRIRQAVNTSDSGVTAQVVTERGTDRIRLEIASLRTGTNHAFSLSDSNGWLEASLDLTESKQSPENTVFSVNEGTVVSTPASEIALDQGRLKLLLNQVPADPVIVTVLPVLHSFRDEVGGLIGRYNALTRTLSDSRDLLDPSIEAAVRHAAPAEELQGLGILRAEDGTLQLNEPILLRNLEEDFDDWLQRFAGGEGWTNRLIRMTARLEQFTAADYLNTGHAAYRALTTYAYGPGERLHTHLPVPIHGFLMNYYY